MKTSKAIFSAALLISTAFLSGCTKQSGCTDVTATNYNADAEKDCCCEYSGSMVIWYDQTVATYLTNNSVTALTFYADDVLIGSQSASVYWTGAPECNQSQSITTTQKLGEVKSKAFTIKVVDQNGTTLWNTSRYIDANKCVALQLTQ